MQSKGFDFSQLIFISGMYVVKGGPKPIKFQKCISSEAYPIPMGYTKKHQKCQFCRWPGSAAFRLNKYTKETLKNTK